MLKTVEEVGEVVAALARKDQEALRDGIGDVVVLAMQNNMYLYECLDQAYDEIKERTVKMVDGVFVKDNDLEVSKWYRNLESGIKKCKY